MQFTTTLDQIIDTITEVTRYPRSLLDPQADLENDLGIDSVKLVEILVALGQRFGMDLVAAPRDPAMRTIRQMVPWLAERMQESAPAANEEMHRTPSRNQGRSEQGYQPGEPVTRSEPAPLGRVVTESKGVEQIEPEPQRHHRLQPFVPAATTPANQAAAMPVRVDQPGSLGVPKPKHSNGFHGHGSMVNGSANGQAHRADDAEIEEETGAVRKPLSGRVALVTGSGRGVGRVIARLLAKRGATVIVNSFHSRDLGEATAAEIVAQGGAAIHLWGSIANPGHVDDIFDEIQRRYGFLDILVCNASDGRLGRFLEITADDMERAFRTNVIGHHHCARRASPLMQRRGGGAIVTMSSIAARRFVEGLGAQGVVKAAVESLTRHLACELGGFGIRTNCVAGGPVYGQVLSNYPDARATLNYWETLIPDGELCTPSDLARTVAFLVSDEARGVNGAVWNVDHGLATRSHSRPLPRVQSDVADPTEVH